MKRLYLLWVLLIVSVSLSAQPPRDRDSLTGGGGLQPWHLQAMQVPALLHPVQQKTFLANDKLCFDKKIFMKGTAGGRMLDMYLYINTADGYIAIMNGREGTLGDGGFDVEEEHFRLTVVGKKGNTYSYFNRKKKGHIEHYVSTSNSEQYLYQFSPAVSNASISKKTVRNSYCGDKFKTWAYKADGADAPVMHVFGRTYPNKLVPKEFLGYSGVGYLDTDAGIYIVCEMEKGSFDTEMRTFDDQDICFDPASFQKTEERMYADIDQGMKRQQEKLENKTYSGSCSVEKEKLKKLKLQHIQKRQETLQRMQQGNVLQDKNTQKAYAQMMDPTDQAEEALLDIDVSICKLEDRISKSNGNDESSQQKIACLNSKKGRIQASIVQMKALDARYANEPGKAYAEKLKLVGDMMGGCN